MKLQLVYKIVIFFNLIGVGIYSTTTYSADHLNTIAKTNHFKKQTDSSYNQYYLFLLGSQFRYEDGSDQSRRLRTYNLYSLAYQFNQFYLSPEFRSFKESSSDGGIQIQSKTNDLSINFGFELFDIQLFSKCPALKLRFLPLIQLGATQTKIATTLLGETQTDKSEIDLVAGVGLTALVKYSWFVTSFDGRIVNSKNYSPNPTFLTTLKIGVAF